MTDRRDRRAGSRFLFRGITRRRDNDWPSGACFCGLKSDYERTTGSGFLERELSDANPNRARANVLSAAARREETSAIVLDTARAGCLVAAIFPRGHGGGGGSILPHDPERGIVRLEFLDGELLYAMRVVTHGRFNPCASPVCNPALVQRMARVRCYEELFNVKFYACSTLTTSASS